ncbi:unnamed protein product [Arabis nemorensis]|uniref:Ubiquitin-like protease family profile domain-containing protein n=1 Tax=Arabis nemorensis TaxID=586526 RepID=A0A565BJ79_9BRAS|nr:unnamed protein product [Arabis nemorensis]
MERIKLSCLLLVDIIPLATSADGKIIDSHVRMIRDFDVFLQHPWGRECFAFTMKSIKAKEVADMGQKSMAIRGFIHGLQLVALTCIPEITSYAATEKNTKQMEVNVAYTLPAEGLEGEDFTWPNKKDDAKVLHMIDLVNQNHIFTKASWSGRSDATTLSLEKKDNVNAKKGKNKCDAADVSPGRNRKTKGKNLENDKGQISENITHLTMADVQDLIDNPTVVYYNKLLEELKEFDAKFTCLLQNQDGAIKNELRDMSHKLNGLSEQIVVLKSQQSTVFVVSVAKDILATTKKSSDQSTTMETTTNPHVIEKNVAPSSQPDKSLSEKLVTQNIMGVVTEVLGKEGAADDAHANDANGNDAQPKENLRVSFAPPHSPLDLCRKEFLFPKLQQNNQLLTQATHKELNYETNIKKQAATDDSVFEMLLKALETTSWEICAALKLCFLELWKQEKRLSNTLMDNLLFFVRERFFEEFKARSTKPIQFMEIEFGVEVSKMHPKFNNKSYKIPKKISKYVSRDRQWHTDVELLYGPYIIHGNWVCLCIDLPSHEITVLLPDPTEYAIKEVEKELLSLASSLLFLITNCATNAEMEADIATPLTITIYAGEWEIKCTYKESFIRCD